MPRRGAAAERAPLALSAHSPFGHVRNGVWLYVAVAVQGLLRHVRRIDRQLSGSGVSSADRHGPAEVGSVVMAR
jgi:hypothetical protein